MMHCDFDTGSIKINIFKELFRERVTKKIAQFKNFANIDKIDIRTPK